MQLRVLLKLHQLILLGKFLTSVIQELIASVLGLHIVKVRQFSLKTVPLTNVLMTGPQILLATDLKEEPNLKNSNDLIRNK